MKLEGKTDIHAPAREVWDLILDPARLSTCVPGASQIREVDDRTIEGTVRVAVGPMQADFAFTSVITRNEFPDDLVVEMSGMDSMTKSMVQARIAVELEVLELDRTRMRYRAVIDVAGRLAVLSDMVLRVTAGAMIDKVVRCIGTRLDPAVGREGGHS